MASIKGAIKKIFGKEDSQSKPAQSTFTPGFQSPASGQGGFTPAPIQSTPKPSGGGGSSSSSSSRGISGSIQSTPNPDNYVGGDQLKRDPTTVAKLESNQRTIVSQVSRPSQPTEREEFLQMSITDPLERTRPLTPSQKEARKMGISLGQRVPTAEEQILLMSIPQPVTRFGRTETKESFQRNIFFEDILGQRQEFYALTPEQVRGKALGGDIRFLGMSTNQGESIFFTPSIERSKAISEQTFLDLPLERQKELRATEVRVGLVKTGVGLFSSTGALISSGFDSTIGKERISFSERERRIETNIIGRIPGGKSVLEFTERPVGVTGRATELFATTGLAVAGGVGVVRSFSASRAYGLTRTESALEVLGIASPLRPKAGVFSRPVLDTDELKFISQVNRNTDGTQTRIIKGIRDDDLFFESKQTFRVGKGGQEIALGKIETNVIQRGLRIGGGNVKDGLVFSGSEGVFVSTTKTGQPRLVRDIFQGTDRAKVIKLLDATGGVSKVGTVFRPKFSVFLEETSPGKIKGFGQLGGSPFSRIYNEGAISKDIDDSLKAIVGGRSQATLTKQGIVFRIKKTNIRGFEFKTKIGDDYSNIFSFKGAGKSTPFSSTFTEQLPIQTLKASIQGATTKPTIRTTSIFLPQRTTSAFVGTGLYERTEGGLLPGFMQSQRTKNFETVSIQKLYPPLTLPQLPKEKFKPLSFKPSEGMYRQGQISILSVLQASNPLQNQKSIPLFKIPTRSIITTIPTIPIIPSKPRIAFPEIFALTSRPGRSTPLFSSRGSRYSPSLTSTSFNIVGDIPKRFRGGVVDPFSRRVIQRSKARKKRRK